MDIVTTLAFLSGSWLTLIIILLTHLIFHKKEWKASLKKCGFMKNLKIFEDSDDESSERSATRLKDHNPSCGLQNTKQDHDFSEVTSFVNKEQTDDVQANNNKNNTSDYLNKNHSDNEPVKAIVNSCQHQVIPSTTEIILTKSIALPIITHCQDNEDGSLKKTDETSKQNKHKSSIEPIRDGGGCGSGDGSYNSIQSKFYSVEQNNLSLPLFSRYSISSISTDFSPSSSNLAINQIFLEEDKDKTLTQSWLNSAGKDDSESSFLQDLPLLLTHNSPNWRASVTSTCTDFSPTHKRKLTKEISKPEHNFPISSPASMLSSHVSPAKVASILANPARHALQDSECSIGMSLKSFTKYLDNMQEDNLLEIKPKFERTLPHQCVVTERAEIEQSGGFVCIAGCSITFPSDSTRHVISGEFSFIFSPQVTAEQSLVISPMIECEPCDMTIPFTVAMPTIYSSHDAVTTIQQSDDDDDDWKDFTEVSLGDSRLIEFKTNSLTRFRAIVSKKEISNISKNLLSVGFLKRTGYNQDRISLIWCILDDWPHLVARIWLEMLPPNVYERILEPKTFVVRSDADVTLSVISDSFIDKSQNVFIPNCDIWSTTIYRKYEFVLNKCEENFPQMSINYFVSTNHGSNLLKGSSEFDWNKPSTISQSSNDRFSIPSDDDGSLKNELKTNFRNNYSEENLRNHSPDILTSQSSKSTPVHKQDYFPVSSSDSTLVKSSSPTVAKKIRKQFFKSFRKKRQTV